MPAGLIIMFFVPEKKKSLSRASATELTLIAQTAKQVQDARTDSLLWYQKLTNNLSFLDCGPFNSSNSYKSLFIAQEKELYKDLDLELIKLFQLLREGNLSQIILEQSGYANYKAMLDEVFEKQQITDAQGYSILSAINNQSLYDDLYKIAVDEYNNNDKLPLDKSRLRLACQYNQATSVIRNFLPKVPHETLAKTDKNLSLKAAAKNGFIDVIKLLCQTSTHAERYDALLVTIETGQEVALRYLLESYRFYNLRKAASLAFCKSLHIKELLLDHAQPQAIAADFIREIKVSNIEAINSCLKSKAINKATLKKGLYLAVYLQKLDLTNLLLKAAEPDFNINEISTHLVRLFSIEMASSQQPKFLLPNTGITLLMAAASHGNIPLVKALIGAGADLEQKDDLGQTAIFYAIRNKQFAMLVFLHQITKANLKALRNDSNSVLHLALEQHAVYQENSDLNILLYLIDNCRLNIGLINSFNSSHQTPLKVCDTLSGNKKELIKLALINVGGAVNLDTDWHLKRANTGLKIFGAVNLMLEIVLILIFEDLKNKNNSYYTGACASFLLINTCFLPTFMVAIYKSYMDGKLYLANNTYKKQLTIINQSLKEPEQIIVAQPQTDLSKSIEETSEHALEEIIVEPSSGNSNILWSQSSHELGQQKFAPALT